MNAKVRKQVADLLNRLRTLQSEAESIGEELTSLSDEEQEKFNNLSEGLQATERGQALEEAAGKLQEAADACAGGEIQNAIDALEGLE